MNEINIQKGEIFQTALTGAPDYKLFSAGQIAVATIFGSIIAGQIMLALNYAKLKDAKRANRKLLVTLVSLLIWGLISPLFFLFFIYFTVSFYPEFKQRQGDKYIEHIALGGERCSNWDVAALCVLSYIIFSLFFIFIKVFLHYAFS